MKKILLLVPLIIGCALKEEIVYAPTVPYEGVMVSTSGWSEPIPKIEWAITIEPADPILLIDQYGDIFLRGKWIGYDARLSEKARRSW